MKKVLIVLAGVVAVAGITVQAMGGVAWLDSMGLRGQEKLVESRLKAYWDARVDGDLARMSEFIHPLQEAVPDPGMLVTESYEIADLTVAESVADARLQVKSRLKHPILSSRERDVELVNRWVKYEGNWYVDVTPIGLNDVIKKHKGEWTHPSQQAVQ
jgi:hypothetical protein